MDISFKKYQQTNSQCMQWKPTAPSLHLQFAGKVDKCNPLVSIIVLKDEYRLAHLSLLATWIRISPHAFIETSYKR